MKQATVGFLWLVGTAVLPVVGCATAVGAPATTAPEPTDRPPTTLPVPVPSDGAEGPEVDAPPPPAAGYPPSVLGEVDTSSARLTIHPVAQCRADGRLRTPVDGEVVALYPEMATQCLLGPAYATGSNFSDAKADLDFNSGRWGVEVDLDSDGSAAFNQLAELCFSADPACPAQQIAIVVDDTVVSAPNVAAPSFGDNLRISGNYDDDEATELAEVINGDG